MKHLKSRGGADGGNAELSGLQMRKYGSNERLIRTVYERSQFLKATLGMLTDSSDANIDIFVPQKDKKHARNRLAMLMKQLILIGTNPKLWNIGSTARYLLHMQALLQC